MKSKEVINITHTTKPLYLLALSWLLGCADANNTAAGADNAVEMSSVRQALGTIPSQGDVNWDGKVTILNALAVTQYVSGENPSRFYEEAADVNCDGAINDEDASLIGRY